MIGQFCNKNYDVVNKTLRIYQPRNYVEELVIDDIYSDILNIDCKCGTIKKILNFPKKLVYLNCSNNSISDFSNLPNTLKYLDCRSNCFLNLDFLPESLLELYCSSKNHNQDIRLDNLPNSLLLLYCSGIIINLQNLPKNLRELTLNCCLDDSTSSYQNLPPKLCKLDIFHSGTKISFDTIPENLYYIRVDHETICNFRFGSGLIQNLDDLQKYVSLYVRTD